MKNIYVRWLGAFRKNSKQYNLFDSIMFESSRTDEAACEEIHYNQGNVNAMVGILVAPEKIFRSFRCDCWSEYGYDGKLYATDPHRKSNHNEQWYHCSDAVVGIVVKNSFSCLRKEIQTQITKAVDKTGLPVYGLRTNGKLVREL